MVHRDVRLKSFIAGAGAVGKGQLLCDLTARTIQKGLDLLGIQVVEKM